MATVETIVRAALGDLAVEQHQLLNGVRWVNDRYAELAGTVRLKQLRRLGELTVPAVITTGTVSVTNGSDVVTGNATAVAAWTTLMQDRYFQIDRVWYRIAGTTLADNVFTLAEPYAGRTASAQSYRIVARYALLHQDCRTIIGMVHDRFNREIIPRSLTWLNMLAPERFYQLGGPQAMVDLGEDAATRRRVIELYPYSNETEHLRYAYYAKPPRLGLDDELSASVDQDALKEGVLIDVMRWKMAKAADEGKVEIAALWRNEYRAQETAWMKTLQRLIKADTVLEDLAWATRATNGGRPYGDITTARDQVWAAGLRP